MRRTALVAVALALLAAGCDDSQQPRPAAQAPAAREGLRSPEGVMIRDWLMSVQHGDFGRAATFFAPGAIIDQGDPYRLRNRAAARLFNATLPCHADLIALTQETSAKVLATFSLRAGPGGPCRGEVRVRYTIKHGKFTEWRQLPEREGEPSVTGPAV